MGSQELRLRSGTDDDLAHINIGSLLDRERNSAGDRAGMASLSREVSS